MRTSSRQVLFLVYHIFCRLKRKSLRTISDLLITNQLHYRLCYTSMGLAVPKKFSLCIAALRAAKSRCAVAARTPSAEGVPTVLHQQKNMGDRISPI